MRILPKGKYKMKRLISVFLLASILVLGLASCQAMPLENKTVAEALSVIEKNMSSQTALRTICETEIKVSDEEGTRKVGMEMSASVKKGENDTELYGKITLNISDILTQFTYCAADGVFYLEQVEDNIELTSKANIEDEKKMLDVYSVNTEWSALSSVYGMSMKEKNGKYVFSASGVSAEFIDRIAGNSGIVKSIFSVSEFPKMSFKMTASPDGFCENIKLEFFSESQEISINVDYRQLGPAFATSVPENAENYELTEFEDIMEGSNAAESVLMNMYDEMGFYPSFGAIGDFLFTVHDGDTEITNTAHSNCVLNISDSKFNINGTKSVNDETKYFRVVNSKYYCQVYEAAPQGGKILNKYQSSADDEGALFEKHAVISDWSLIAKLDGANIKAMSDRVIIYSNEISVELIEMLFGEISPDLSNAKVTNANIILTVSSGGFCKYLELDASLSDGEKEYTCSARINFTPNSDYKLDPPSDANTFENIPFDELFAKL